MSCVPYLMAFCCGALGIVQIHLALGQGGLQDAMLGLSLWVLGMGCLFSFVIRSRQRQWVAANLGEQVGAWLLTLTLFAISTLIAMNQLSWEIEGWQLFLIFLALFSFFLRSQNAFIMLGVTAGVVLLIAQALRPSLGAAIGFISAFVLLLASQALLERRERFPGRQQSADWQVWLKATLLGTGVLLAIFLGIYRSKPAARRTSPRQLVSSWASEVDRVARRLPFSSKGKIRAPTLLDPQADPPQAHQPKGLLIDFDRDLKFGDANPQAMHRPSFYLRLLDARGRRLPPDDKSLQLTMAAASDYDGKSWRGDQGELTRLIGTGGQVRLPERRRGRLIQQQYILLPFREPLLPAVYPVTRVGLPVLRIDREGILSRDTPQFEILKYRLHSKPWRPDPRQLRLARVVAPDPRYLAFPKALMKDRYFSLFAGRVRRLHRPYQRIQWLMAILSRFRYSLQPGFDAKKDPTLEFLRHRRGYCQHYCSAMALLLRAVGIPTRVVVGWSGGDWHEQGQYYVVRTRNAHSWVQVHFERFGWVDFDPVRAPLQTFVRQLGGRPPTIVPRPDRPSPDPSPDGSPPDKPDKPAPDKPEPDKPDKPEPDSPEPDKPDKPAPDGTEPDKPEPDGPEPDRPEPDPPGNPQNPNPELPEGRENVFDSLWDKAESPRSAGAARKGAKGSKEATAASKPPSKPSSRAPYWPSWPQLLSLPLVGGLLLCVGLAGLIWLLLKAGLAFVSRPQRTERKASLPARPPVAYDTPGTIEHQIVALTMGLVERLGQQGYLHQPTQTLAEYAAVLPKALDLHLLWGRKCLQLPERAGARARSRSRGLC